MEHDAIGAVSTMCALGDPLGETLIGEAGARTEAGGTERNVAERYEFRGSLGAGGMGQVDQLWDTDLMRDLAVKRLRQELRDNTTLLNQFLWEARVTASLEHPNVVPVHDLGVTPTGDVYFTMKHVKGESLGDVIKRLRDSGDDSAMPLSRRLRLFLQLCQAVDFAHSRGVLHRDLKPANVMLGDHGELLLMDWGLALCMPGGQLETMAKALPERTGPSGTPLYMAPEQIDGIDLDSRADIYSLGVMLYELIALELPFEGSTISEILTKVGAGNSKPLTEAAPQVSRSLVSVVQKAMALDREDRYATAGELLLDVERYLDGRTPEAENASLARKLVRYAVHEDPRLATVKPLELDLIIGGALLAGGGLGVLLATRLDGWALPLLIVGTLMSIPFFVTWIKTLKQR